jgi:hypothetical protein
MTVLAIIAQLFLPHCDECARKSAELVRLRKELEASRTLDGVMRKAMNARTSS